MARGPDGAHAAHAPAVSQKPGPGRSKACGDGDDARTGFAVASGGASAGLADLAFGVSADADGAGTGDSAGDPGAARSPGEPSDAAGPIASVAGAAFAKEEGAEGATTGDCSAGASLEW